MGQNKKQTPMMAALRSSESVNVTAKRPKPSEPYPDNIDEIYLGTKYKLPTGTYTPPHGFPKLPQGSPMMSGILGNLEERPALTSMINLILSRKNNPEEGGRSFPSYGKSVVELNPDYPNQDEAFYHEAAHAAHRQQFPDGGEAMKQSYFGGREDWDTYQPTTFKEYQNIPGEHLARAIAAAALKRKGRK
jgi:hypothetical protein